MSSLEHKPNPPDCHDATLETRSMKTGKQDRVSETDLKRLSLDELQALAKQVETELETRAFAESMEAQVRLFMRRRDA